LFGDNTPSKDNKVKRLSTRLKDKEEKIKQIIDELTEESAKGKLVVVEGKNDELALQELGVCGKFLTVKTGGKSFLQASEEIERLGVKEVVLLLDFDRRGKEGTFRLKYNLERAKIKADMRFWRELQALVGRDIRCIESLQSFLSTLQEKASLAHIELLNSLNFCIFLRIVYFC
jgi:5S rRNA maturation endonuclease (ribonuclease M5)